MTEKIYYFHKLKHNRVTAAAVVAPTSKRPRKRSCTNIHVASKTPKCQFRSRFKLCFHQAMAFKFCVRVDLDTKNAMQQTACRNSIFLIFYEFSNFAIFDRTLSSPFSFKTQTKVHVLTHFPLSNFNEISYTASLLQYLESFFSEF